MSQIRLAIADDHSIFIEGLLLLLNKEKTFHIGGIANDADTLLQLIEKEPIDIVLLDINMPGLNGIDAIKFIKQRNERIRIIMLSTYNEKHLIRKAKEQGADGYLIKNVHKTELIRAIHQVNEGKKFFTGEDEPEDALKIGDPFLMQYSFTRKEKELLELIKQGLTNKQMADHMSLSIYTIETHRKNIMQKLKLKSPIELARFLMNYNL